MADPEPFYPTVSFAFSPVRGETLLHQLWVDQWGHAEWRQVPMIELGEDKKPARAPSIAGFVPEEDEGE